VDQRLIGEGWLMHSRDPEEIVGYLKAVRSRPFDRVRSKEVQDAVFGELDAILLN
jgi:hypothetical protein